MSPSHGGAWPECCARTITANQIMTVTAASQAHASKYAIASAERGDIRRSDTHRAVCTAVTTAGTWPLTQLLFLAAAAICGGGAAFLVIREWPHFELISLALQVLVLLPALLLVIRAPGQCGMQIPWRPIARASLMTFVVVAAALSWRLCHGLIIPDESSYRHQARILASGKLSVAAPPGAAQLPIQSARPIRFAHELVWARGWYSKYPLLWPLVLAIPEALGAGWLVTPALGVLLLIIIGRIAREVFSPDVADATLVLTALSPAFMVYCTGRLPHALAGVLVAGATLACLQGVRTRRVSRILWMFVLLVCAFHVRPFTAFVTAVVLGSAALWMSRRDRRTLIRVAIIAGAGATVSIVSVLAYNRAFTGQPLVSPYALVRGVDIPTEINASAATIFHSVLTTWRFSAQCTLLFSVPFLFPAAAAGFWMFRKHSWAIPVLAVLFCGMVLAHLVQPEPSGSPVGERYWFEGFFAVTTLAAAWIVRFTSTRRLQRAAAMTLGLGFALVQIGLIVAAGMRLDSISGPRREMRQLAETFRDCHCVVFFEDDPPFYGEHLNLNGPDWQSTHVFYAVDPGASQRDQWAAKLGRQGWVALRFDTAIGRAEIASTRLNLNHTVTAEVIPYPVAAGE